MYVQMGQLKQMKALEEKGLFIRIFFKVKWTDGTESKVKMKYMN